MLWNYAIPETLLTTRDKSLHLLSELLERWQIRLKRNIGGINSSKSYGLYAENLLILRFCAENDIAVLHQRLHHFGSSTTVVPKFLAEIQITRDGKPHTVGYFKRFPASVGSLLRKGGSNARPMKPACIGKMVSQSIIPGRSVAKEEPSRSYTTLEFRKAAPHSR